jgi:hypothetical protein
VYLTNAPVILHCKAKQEHNCHIILRLVYLSNIRAEVHLPSVCLAIVTVFPQLVCLENVREAQRITLIVHTQVTSVFVKCGPVVGTKHCAPQTLVMPRTCVTFTDSRWEKGKWAMFVQLHRSHDVSNTPVVTTRLNCLWHCHYRTDCT